ncbi:MAG: S41 family peptidase [Ignavibacteriaceae bacterium]
MKNLKKKFLIIFITANTLLLTGFIAGNSDIYFEIAKNLDLLGKVYKEISYNYVDDIDPKEFMRAGIKGMLSTLDPYTTFVDEGKQQDIDLMTNGKYGGIGVSIGVRGDKVTIVEVIDGYSAQKQGIRIGDVLIRANDISIGADNVDEVSNLVKGQPGTTVDLTILRNESQDTLLFSIVREEIILRNITYAKFFPENSNNAYIKLSNFSRTAGDELRTALKKLSLEKEIESVVLDLRGNPGGLLDVAIDICEKFLQKDQLVVSTKGKEETSLKHFFSKEQPVAGNQKLIILVNGTSASASEIVAGAIQDHDRGIILGTQSFGKGLVQTIIPLTNNTSLKITTAKYYTPSGRSIQKIDYSKDNPIIVDADSILLDPFQTDNRRTVYSAGGITPDTTVELENSGEITQQFLAKGFIFSFADKYYYENPEANFDKLNDEVLLQKFQEYLAEKEYNFTSSFQKRLTEIISDLESDELYNDIKDYIKTLTKKLETGQNKALQKHSYEIITEIRSELANRYIGYEKGFEERLKHDRQFNAAVELLNDTGLYNRLLNKM